MPSSANLTLDELSRLLRAADPAALLVPARIIRRVIQADHEGSGLGLQVPHRHCYVVERDRLLSLADATELGLDNTAELPDRFILLRRPGSAGLTTTAPTEILLRFWRLLFHGRVHLALRQRFQEGKLNAAAVQQRLDSLGVAEVEEIRNVLVQERLLLPPADDCTLYEEFAALYLELYYFARPLLTIYFPGSAEAGAIRAVLAADVDADYLWSAIRPAGAAEPVFQQVAAALAAELPAEEEAETPLRTDTLPLTRGRFQRLLRRADRVASRGNHVRSAILRTRAANGAAAAYATLARAGARDDLRRLGSRLQRALELSTAQAKPLRRLLPALLASAAAGIWPVAARLLYDLQKVCVDHERAIYQLDLLKWLFSLGHKPLKRPLPGQETVRALQHLRGALHRLAAVPIPYADRRRLADILRAAIERTEERVRAHFRPLVQETLEEVGLQPHNLPEDVARHKLVEELLDRVIERGFLTIGDLRDALSRNQLKLPDLAGPGEWLVGDPLLRTNRLLASALAGTYHPGEVYMRWLQRLSSLAFGNPLGRFLTRYFVLPFGSSFVILGGTEALIHEGSKLLGSHAVPAPPPPPAEDEESWFGVSESDFHPKPAHVPILNPYSVVILGVFLLLLFHVPSFRNLLWQGLCALGRGLRWLFMDLPAALARLPAVQAFLQSKPWHACKQFVLKPALIAAPFVVLFPLCRAGSDLTASAAIVLYLAAVVALNTRLGRYLEETATDRAARLWDHIRIDFVPGLFHWVVGIFKRLMEGMERVIYTVDELLRFRSGDSRLSLGVKAVLGVGWAAVTYLVRIFINLFVEPTFNPIKHFPVVTVTAKMIVPIIKPLGEGIVALLAPVVGVAVGGLVAGLIIIFLPGLAGFLVWEFKENWRLYRANRPKELRPVVVGHHGETVRRLLRPGIHSGTVPKLYAKLRKAAQTGERTGAWTAFARQREALHHVAEAVRRFVEREFCRPLEETTRHASPFVTANRDGPAEMSEVRVSAVELATNSIRVDIASAEQAIRLTITEQGGCLWASPLVSAASPRTALDTALAGLYKMSGVDRVDGVQFDQVTITWQQWVQTWEGLKAGKDTARVPS